MTSLTKSFLVLFLLIHFVNLPDAWAGKKVLKICKKEDNTVRARKRCGAKRGWTEISYTELQGEKGDTGNAGAAGANGADGADGSDGMDSAWGDGSAGDETISVNTIFDSDNPQYENFTVENGVTLTVASGTLIRCTGNFVNDGTIEISSGTSTTYRDPPSTANVVELSANFPHMGIATRAASFGELGAANDSLISTYGGSAPAQYSLKYITRPLLYAGGAGGVGMAGSGGGAGGGAFGVWCEGAVVNNGTVSADGDEIVSGGGGGAGGIIILASASSVTNAGSITVDGGDGGDSDGDDESNGGGGGGGLIHILAPSISLGGGTTSVAGGTGGSVLGALNGGASNWASGGGGGACAGSGGAGGGIAAGSSTAAGSGSAGVVIERDVDNPAGLL